jgi:hypothetical protein
LPILGRNSAVAEKQKIDTSDAAKNTIRRALHEAQGALAYSLEAFGDEIAKREGYKEHEGMDAIYFYLVRKYNWPPAQVRAMNSDDLRFLLEEEMSGWTWPKDVSEGNRRHQQQKSQPSR